MCFSNILKDIVTKIIADAVFWQLPIFSSWNLVHVIEICLQISYELDSHGTDLYSEENWGKLLMSVFF